MYKVILQFVFLVSTIGLVACEGPSTKAESAVPQSSDKPQVQKLESPQILKSEDINFNSPDLYTRMKGHYIFGEGVETFTPCGDTKKYWIFTGSEEQWASLRDKHDNVTTKPYEGAYIELFGWLGPKLHPVVGGEYASDSDGHVVVDDFLEIRKLSPSDCE